MKKYALYTLPLVAVLLIGIGFAMDARKKIDAENAGGPPKIGDMAPDLIYKSPDGDTSYRLSDLKGKIVLVDFWASWCKPCRQENVNLVKTYHKYKSAGFRNATEFTVYSVSLDADGDKWKKAIAQDGLKWPYHVSDLKYWQSEAASIYGVDVIPANFLLDETGKIVAINVRGKNLDTELEKLR